MTLRSYIDSVVKYAVMLVSFAWSALLLACLGNEPSPAKISETIFPAIPPLFFESSTEITPEPSIDPTITQSRYVKLNLDILGESEVGDAILLNLFEGVVYTAILEKKETNLSQSYTWSGCLEGIQHSQVILIVGGNQVAGNITLPGAFYEIRYTKDGVHAVTQIDQSAFPQEGEPIVPGE